MIRWWHSGAASLLLAAGMLLRAAAGLPAVTFTDVTRAAGIDFVQANSATSDKYLIETMPGGVGLIDFDNDGWMDIYLVNGAQLHAGMRAGEQPDKRAPKYWNRLYRNNHDGTFRDVTDRAGVQGKGYGMGVAVGDYDGDGFDDLLVTNYGSIELYRNNHDGTFSDRTAAAGLTATGWFSSAGFFDYNNDGKLDLFLCRYLDWTFDKNTYCGSKVEGGRAYCHPDLFPAVTNLLLRNNGDGTFSDVSAATHVASAPGKGLGVAFADFNRDGKPDITVANDSVPQTLLLSNPDGTYTESALTAGVAYTDEGKTFAGMGTDAADLDGDGLPDIVSTALSDETYSYFHNNGDGSFRYDTAVSRLGAATRLLGGWGMRIFDYDNDGQRDLLFADSHVMDNIHQTQPHLEYRQPMLLLHGDHGRFTNVSAQSGAVFQQRWASRGAAFGDLDNDGDVDVVIATCGGPAYVLRNDGGNRNHWLALDLRGVQDNRDGIGAEVTITTAAATQRGQVTTTASYQSAQDRRLFFGLDKEAVVKRVDVKWPTGTHQQLLQVPAGQILRVIER